MSENNSIHAEKQGGLLFLTLTLNEKNVINGSFIAEMNRLLDEAKSDRSLRAIAIQGSNGFFSNGFDPVALLNKSGAEIYNIIGKAFLICGRLLYDNPLPVFACLNGHAMGYGAILPLYCDYRYAVDKSGRIGFPEILIGLPLPLAPSLMLQRICGFQVAYELATTGKALKTPQALEIKYLDAIFEDEQQLIAAVQREVRRISGFPRDVYSLNRQNLFHSWRESLERAIEIDAEKSAEIIQTANAQEGLRSILENRRPKFQEL